MVEWREKVEVEKSLLDKRGSGLRSLVGGLPDNAGMLRAVAELTSVGFEGGVLRLNQNPGSTRGITTSFLEFSDPSKTN